MSLSKRCCLMLVEPQQPQEGVGDYRTPPSRNADQKPPPSKRAPAAKMATRVAVMKLLFLPCFSPMNPAGSELPASDGRGRQGKTDEVEGTHLDSQEAARRD